MGQSASKRAKKEAIERSKEIDDEVRNRLRRHILLLIGNEGAGKRTIVDSLMKLNSKQSPIEDEEPSINFSYNLKSFEINEYAQSKESSSQLKHLDAVMSMLEQKRLDFNTLSSSQLNSFGGNRLDYDEAPNDNIFGLVTPFLVSAFYNSITHKHESFPDDICQIIIAFARREKIFSYSWEIRSNLFEIWNSNTFDQLSLFPLFIYTSAIIFVVDISGYDEFILDKVSGKKVNKLCRDFNLFCDFVGMWKQYIDDLYKRDNHTSADVFLFLNKDDLFKEKLKTIPLSRCELFSDFDDNANGNEGDDDKYFSALDKIRGAFKDEFVEKTKSHRVHHLYVEVMNAKDVDMMQKIFLVVHKTVINSALQRAAMAEKALPQKGNMFQILPYLYLATYQTTLDIKSMKLVGITHIINLCNDKNEGPKAKQLESFQIMHLPIPDEETFDIRTVIETASFYIDKLAQNDDEKSNNKVVINCHAAKSRSVSVIIGYLMIYKNMKLKAAYDRIVSIKEDIEPNLGFIATLMKMEKEMYKIKNFKAAQINEIRRYILKNTKKTNEQISNALDKCNGDHNKAALLLK